MNKLFRFLALSVALLSAAFAASPTSVPTTSGGSWKISDWQATQLYLVNYSTVAQTPTAATRTLIAGSTIAVPTAGLKVGSVFKWRLNLTKTAAGTATSTFDVGIGTTGTVSDSAVISFTKPAGTAAVDEGWVEVDAVVRGPITASCIASGEFVLLHNLSATGHAQIPCVVVNTVSSAFDATVGNLIVGLYITTGASDAITIQQVTTNAGGL